MTKLKRTAAIFLAAITLLSMFSVSAFAANGTEPAHTKSIAKNSEDSYTLTLDVTGQGTEASSSTTQQKVDIVVVGDMSYSMNNKDSTSTDYYGNTRTKSETMMRALISRPSWSYEGILVDALDSEADVQISVIGFTNTAATYTSWTDDESTIYSAVWRVNGQYGNETNIQAGLKQAADVLSSARSDAKKVVVFISDGDPNVYTNESGSTVVGSSKFTQEAADAALAQADEMLDDVDEFYAIGYAYQTTGADFISTLTEKFNGTEYNAANSTQLSTALSDSFVNAVKEVEAETLRAITITDVLSENVELDGEFAPIVTLDGEAVSGNQYIATADGKTLSVKFADSFVVAKDKKLAVSFNIKPTEAAKENASAEGTAYLTNDNAALTYTYGNSSAVSKTVAYAEKPEITLTKSSETVFDVELTKTLYLAKQGVAVPNETFQFTFTAATDGDSEPADKVPAIAPIEIAVSSADENVNGAVTKALAEEIAVDFPETGIYKYEVKEVKGDNANIQYDDQIRIMKVKVIEGLGGKLEVSDVVYYNANGEKEALEFENTYTKEGTLTVSKTVAGNPANTEKKFAYTISFTKDDVNEDKDITAKFFDKDGNETKTETNISAFELGNGESVVFSAPAGTLYEITESGNRDYLPTAEVTAVNEEGEEVEDYDGDVNDSLTVTSYVGEGGTSVAFTNTYIDNPLTGIIQRNGPFILAVAGVIAAIALFFILDRKRRAARA